MHLYAVTAERMELKEAFTKQYAKCKVHTVQASKLWNLLKDKPRQRTVSVLLIPASEANCVIKEGTGKLYVCVWMYDGTTCLVTMVGCGITLLGF